MQVRSVRPGLAREAEDLAGRGTAFDFHSTFRTRDTEPPQVLHVSPEDDPDGLAPVGPDVVPIVSCSESMAPESVSPSTVQLLGPGDLPVDTVVDLQREGKLPSRGFVKQEDVSLASFLENSSANA